VRACSEGRPHAEHDAPPAWTSERRFAVASRAPIEDEVLARWELELESREILRIEESF